MVSTDSTKVLQRNNVTVHGRDDGAVLLFAHGFGCDQGMWSEVASRFESTHRIVLFDYVGAGGSDLAAYDPERYASLDGYATDAIEICDALGVSDVTFIGHSVSTMIGVDAVVRRPDLFSSLVMIAPSPYYLNDPDTGYVGGFESSDIDELLTSLDANYFAWASAVAPMVMGRPDEPAFAQRLEASFCRVDPDIAREFATVTFRSDSRDRLPGVGVPTLILQCRNDALAPSEVGEYMAQQIRRATLVSLEAMGHCPHVSAPLETTAAISSFLGIET